MSDVIAERDLRYVELDDEGLREGDTYTLVMRIYTYDEALDTKTYRDLTGHTVALRIAPTQGGVVLFTPIAGTLATQTEASGTRGQVSFALTITHTRSIYAGYVGADPDPAPPWFDIEDTFPGTGARVQTVVVGTIPRRPERREAKDA